MVVLQGTFVGNVLYACTVRAWGGRIHLKSKLHLNAFNVCVWQVRTVETIDHCKTVSSIVRYLFFFFLLFSLRTIVVCLILDQTMIDQCLPITREIRYCCSLFLGLNLLMHRHRCDVVLVSITNGWMESGVFVSFINRRSLDS